MTAPNLPLSAEDLDIIEFNTDQDADDLTYLVDPRYFERIMTQSRTALDLAAQVAQARAEIARLRTGLEWYLNYNDNTDHKGNYVYFDYYDGKDSFDGGAVALSALLNRLVGDMHPGHPEEYPWWTDRTATGGDTAKLKEEYLKAARTLLAIPEAE